MILQKLPLKSLNTNRPMWTFFLLVFSKKKVKLFSLLNSINFYAVSNISKLLVYVVKFDTAPIGK